MGDIPKDEMLLAEMLAFAKDKGLKHCIGDMHISRINAVCAVGCLSFMFSGSETYCAFDVSSKLDSDFRIGSIMLGNDSLWYQDSELDTGESMGWAYRQAMED